MEQGPKYALEIGGRSLLDSVIQKASRLSENIIVALPNQNQIQLPDDTDRVRYIYGGETRAQSVQKLFHASSCDWVLLSDVTRPFASIALCEQVYKAAKPHGVAGAFLRSDVPAMVVEPDLKLEVIAAEKLRTLQLPQAFSRENLGEILELATANNWKTQSTIELAILAGYAIEMVEGEKTNIKLTTPEDWQMAQSLGHLLT